MIFTLDKYSDFLHKPCEEVDPTSVDTAFVIAALRKEAEITPCAGLAANQIGHKVTIAIMKLDGELHDFTVTINPTIFYITTGDPKIDMTVSVEGCVSDPGNMYAVRRHQHIKLGYFDEAGQPHMLELAGFPAIVAQHEVDHLGGINVVDVGMRVQSVPTITTI